MSTVLSVAQWGGGERRNSNAEIEREQLVGLQERPTGWREREERRGRGSGRTTGETSPEDSGEGGGRGSRTNTHTNSKPPRSTHLVNRIPSPKRIHF